MHYAIDFAGSELRDIARDGTLLRVRLAAAGARDEAGQRGWLAGVTLGIAAATLDGDAAHAFGKIVDGELRHAGARSRRPAVPATLAGDIELALRLANGTQVVIRGDALEAHLAGDALFREDFSC